MTPPAPSSPAPEPASPTPLQRALQGRDACTTDAFNPLTLRFRDRRLEHAWRAQVRRELALLPTVLIAVLLVVIDLLAPGNVCDFEPSEGSARLVRLAFALRVGAMIAALADLLLQTRRPRLAGEALLGLATRLFAFIECCCLAIAAVLSWQGNLVQIA